FLLHRPSTADISTLSLHDALPISKFYQAGLATPQEETIGAAYKGFNDTLASWGQNRIVTQQCGHTWLQTFDEINSFYNSTNQLRSEVHTSELQSPCNLVCRLLLEK